MSGTQTVKRDDQGARHGVHLRGYTMAWATPDDVIDSWIGDDAPDDDLLIAKWIGRA